MNSSNQGTLFAASMLSGVSTEREITGIKEIAWGNGEDDIIRTSPHTVKLIKTNKIWARFQEELKWNKQQ